MDPNWRLNNNEVGTKKTLKCVLRDRENQLLRNRRNDADKEKKLPSNQVSLFSTSTAAVFQSVETE